MAIVGVPKRADNRSSMLIPVFPINVPPVGGEGGIRTHDSLAAIPDFESGAFDHSATSPTSSGADITENILANISTISTASEFLAVSQCSIARVISKDESRGQLTKQYRLAL